MNNYRELKVWNEAMALVSEVYSVLKEFPNFERYALADQIRRSSISVPSNIAEGSARHSQREFYRFLGIASGSLAELSTQIEISRRLNYLTEENFVKLNHHCESLHKMLYKLQATVKASIENQNLRTKN